MERFGLTSLDDLPHLEAGVAGRLAQADVEDEEGVSTAEAGEATDDADAHEHPPLDDA